MQGDDCIQRPLFGGAMSSSFPLRFQDVSNIREVPDHQEAFVDPLRDESLMFELLDLKHDICDSESAVWFLGDLSTEQDSEESLVVEESNVLQMDGFYTSDMPTLVATVVGEMAISKGRQGREARNLVRVYLANLRLKEVATDLLIIAYEPLLINLVPSELMFWLCNPLSESARTVGAGPTIPAIHIGCLSVQEVFRSALTNLKIHDWNLFGARE